MYFIGSSLFAVNDEVYFELRSKSNCQRERIAAKSTSAAATTTAATTSTAAVAATSAATTTSAAAATSGAAFPQPPTYPCWSKTQQSTLCSFVISLAAAHHCGCSDSASNAGRNNWPCAAQPATGDRRAARAERLA